MERQINMTVEYKGRRIQHPAYGARARNARARLESGAPQTGFAARLHRERGLEEREAALAAQQATLAAQLAQLEQTPPGGGGQ